MKIGRNDLCPCGSGKKYKRCCLGKLRINNANENMSMIDSDFGFVIESVEPIDTEEELRTRLDSLLEEGYIQLELLEDAMTKGDDIINLDQRKPKRQKRYKDTST